MILSIIHNILEVSIRLVLICEQPHNDARYNMSIRLSSNAYLYRYKILYLIYKNITDI